MMRILKAVPQMVCLSTASMETANGKRNFFMALQVGRTRTDSRVVANLTVDTTWADKETNRNQMGWRFYITLSTVIETAESCSIIVGDFKESHYPRFLIA